MDALPIAHVGILVADLAESRTRWSRVLELPFSPITRYRPENWTDIGSPEPHLHDARLTFYLGDRPSIEILEFVGVGTHSPTKGEGGHHLAFPPLTEVDVFRQELAGVGVGTDGTFELDGRLVFMFAEASALNNVYTEWVEAHPDHPDVKDDLSPIERLADGSATVFGVETITKLGGPRPASGIVEFGVYAKGAAAATSRWKDITGYEFDPVAAGSVDAERARSSSLPADRDQLLSRGDGTRVRLLEVAGTDAREGIAFLVFADDDPQTTLDRLELAGVPIGETWRDADRLVQFEVQPSYLNNVGVRFRRP